MSVSKFPWLNVAMSMPDPFAFSEFCARCSVEGVNHAFSAEDYAIRLARIRLNMAEDGLTVDDAYAKAFPHTDRPTEESESPTKPDRQCGGCGDEKPITPGMLTMAMSAGLAVTRWLASGAKTLAKEDRQARLDVCRTCEFINGPRCQICGCFVHVKSWMATEDCPKEKWTDGGSD